MNGHISDLFFNLDHDAAKKAKADGTFDGFDEDKMKEQAVWFCETIAAISSERPTPEEVIKDFFARI